MRNPLYLAPFLLAAAGLVGCNQSEPGGKTSDRTPSKETFALKAPVTATTIKQGDKQAVKLTVNRGREFKQDVALKADSPTAGIAVDLEPKTVKASDSEAVNATVSVGKEVPLGNHPITVTATPTTGNATSVEFTIKVDKKE